MEAEIQYFFDKNEDLGVDIVIKDNGLQVNLLVGHTIQFRINIDPTDIGTFRLKLTDHSTNEIISVTELKDDEGGN
jgi:hypothetical protein